MKASNNGFNKNIPLWYQLSETIKSEYLDLDLPDALRLPTEQNLCDRYGASIITVRQALKYLEDSGYISRFRGRGTFVNTEVIKRKETMFLTPTGYRLPTTNPKTKFIDKNEVVVPSGLSDSFGTNGTDVTDLLKTNCGVNYGRIIDSFEAKPASPVVAQFLDVLILTPVILFTTVHRNTDDRIVNVAWTYIRADKYMFSFSRDADT